MKNHKHNYNLKTGLCKCGEQFKPVLEDWEKRLDKIESHIDQLRQMYQNLLFNMERKAYNKGYEAGNKEKEKRMIKKFKKEGKCYCICSYCSSCARKHEG